MQSISKEATRRLLKISALVIAVLVVMTGATAYLLLRKSLPPVDGALSEMQLSAPVTIERDSLGVPTITASTRSDLAYGTGFVHGQDRFFQMDLSRRLAAGELAEIFGDAALEQDRSTRLFRFRHVAAQVLEQASPEEKEVLTAYTHGVNAGLNSLGPPPWEYWLLREQPRAWTEIDTILVIHAMWWDLQYDGLQREKVRRAVNAKLSGPDCGFGWKCNLQYLYPASTKWDSPNITGEPVITMPGVSLPIPPELNIRTKANVTVVQNSDATSPRDRIPPVVGSNSWAVAGSLTATGAALVANDMHLGLGMPTTWYRVRLRMPAQDDVPALDLNGLSLPGTPTISTGSNGHIAWGFTNSYGDWLDLERFSCTEVTDSVLKTPQGDVLTAGLDISKERPDVPPQFEGPLWEIVTTRPESLLARQYADWREFLLTQVDLTLSDLRESCATLERCMWGSHDLVAIRHPLSEALPVGASLLDMKTLQLPGDRDMPRVQEGAFGASARFAVSPGHEAKGYIHIAGGQSGHPLSPWYRAGFDAWIRGTPLPFLPGPARHRLTLMPPADP